MAGYPERGPGLVLEFTTLLLFLYSLAMWSLWVIRPDDWDMGPGLNLVGGDSDYADMG